MDERDLKRAIDSIQADPGMESRVHRAVIQNKMSRRRTGRNGKTNVFQGSVIAAACCVAAAIVVVATSFYTGSMGGMIGIDTTGDRCPAAPGQQQSRADSCRVEVELISPSSIQAGEDISFSASVQGGEIGKLFPTVRVDKGAFTAGSVSASTMTSGSWNLQPDSGMQDGQQFAAVVTATDGNTDYGKSRYLIATYHKEGNTFSLTVSDQPPAGRS